MIRHLVWWDLKPEADGHDAAANAKRLKEQGEAMPAQIPQLLSIEIAIDFLPGTTIPVGMLLHSTHKDLDGMKAYAEHPVHQEFGKIVRAVTENRRCIDYEF